MHDTKFGYLKVGDRPTRMLGSTIPIGVKVTAVDEEFIYCCPPEHNWPKEVGWKFRRTNGAEVDEDLGWDGERVTGSYLVKEGG